MHIAEIETGNLGANGVVGGGYPIAVGAALTAHMKKTDQVALCYAGDGSTNEGSFHEVPSIWPRSGTCRSSSSSKTTNTG